LGIGIGTVKRGIKDIPVTVGTTRYTTFTCVVCKQVKLVYTMKLIQEHKDLQLLIGLAFFFEMRKTALELWKDPKLVEKLGDPNPLVRWVAANFISQKRIPAQVELTKALADPFPEVREAARHALMRLGRGTDFGPRPLATAKEIDQAMRRWNTWLDVQQLYAVSSASDTPPAQSPLPKDKDKKP
jgi:hypothetical protein